MCAEKHFFQLNTFRSTLGCMVRLETVAFGNTLRMTDGFLALNNDVIERKIACGVAPTFNLLTDIHFEHYKTGIPVFKTWVTG